MRKSYFRGGSLIAMATVAILTEPGLASAATPPESSERLEEVVVVARRTEERLQDVPISVTAITPDALRQTSISTGSDLIKLVPSLSVQQQATGQDPNYSLRGIRTGVITYFNEVPASGGAVDNQIWDLSSVQALAGPQGTLFGRNSTGGAILFVPQRPTTKFEGYVEGDIGNYNLRQATAVINIPVNDKLRLRFGGRVIRRDGVVENIAGPDYQSQHRDIARASVLFEPTEKISDYAVIDYGNRDEQPFALITSNVLPTAGCFPVIGCLYGSQPAALGALQNQLGIRKVSSTFPAYNHAKQVGLSNILAVQPIDGITVKYIFGYRTRKVDDLSTKASVNLPIEIGRGISDVKDQSHELQVLGKSFGNHLSWTVGAFYLQEKASGSSSYELFGTPGLPFADVRNVFGPSTTKNQTTAAYAQGTWALTDKANLTAGVRYTEDASKQNSSRRGPQFTFFGPNTCLLPKGALGVNFDACTRYLSASFNATTYNLSLDYHLTSDLLLYATTRRGYNGGGFNPSVPDANDAGSPQPSYAPEHITDYEAGVKAEWHAGDIPVRTNVSVFLAKYTDIQRIQNGISSTGVVFGGIANGPRATIRGVQLESAIRLFPEFTITANYGYLKTRYDEGAPGFPKGNAFAQAPENSVNLTATYHHDVAAGGALVASAAYTYQSEISFQDANAGSTTAFQKGYSIADLRLGWNAIADKPIDISLFVKNLTDEAYALERQDQGALVGFTGSVYNEPRTYGVEVHYRFGA